MWRREHEAETCSVAPGGAELRSYGPLARPPPTLGGGGLPTLAARPRVPPHHDSRLAVSLLLRLLDAQCGARFSASTRSKRHDVVVGVLGVAGGTAAATSQA
ncbi:unnamed protein product [Urochloa humidicola]